MKSKVGIKSRDKLLQAVKDILWSVGYEAMSPATILKESGVGHGSLYHHFKGKEDLAYVAIEEVTEELLAVAKEVLTDEHESPTQRIKAYLLRKRPAMAGCRIGRLVHEKGVMGSRLEQPVRRYFSELKVLLINTLNTAVARGELNDNVDVEALAELLIATVQGAFIVAKGQRDEKAMERALRFCVTIIDSLTYLAKGQSETEVIKR